MSIAEAFRREGWTVREGALIGGAAVDVAAQRTWIRGNVEGRVWAVVIGTWEGPLTGIEDAVGEDSLPMYWIGEDDRKQRATIARELGAKADQRLHNDAYVDGEAIVNEARVPALKAPAYATGNADGIVEQWRGALLETDIDNMHEQMDVNVGRCELLHVIAIAKELDKPWVRFQQSELIGGGTRWLDVVAAEHADDYVRALHRHYNEAFMEREFKS